MLALKGRYTLTQDEVLWYKNKQVKALKGLNIKCA